MTYTIFTLLYTVLSGSVFLSCLMIALFRRKPSMFAFAASFGFSTLSALVMVLQTVDNIPLTAILGNVLFMFANILLYHGTRLFYENEVRWPKRFWAYLAFGTLVIVFFTLARYDIIARSIFFGLFCSALFADFAFFLRPHYDAMPLPIRTAFMSALAVTEASYVGRIVIAMSTVRVPDASVRAEELNIYVLAAYAVTSIFWLTTLILLDDSRMMEDLRQQNLILEPMAHTDKLTGLFNRNKLYAALSDYINLTRRLEKPLCLVLIDIDYFKDVNDTFGHAAGDQVLIRMADIIRRNVRCTDRVFRWGGEEFLILAVGTSAEGGLVLAESLRQKVAADPFPVTGHMTASFGVAEQLPDERFESWFRRTDLALYQAKKAGRNQVKKWDGGEWPAGTDTPGHLRKVPDSEMPEHLRSAPGAGLPG